MLARVTVTANHFSHEIKPMQLGIVDAGGGDDGGRRRFEEKTNRFSRAWAGYKHKITTTSPLAQRYFDQGIGFYHGFNHAEAIRSFQAALAADPKCAMAHWGIALACGPHINLPIVPPPSAELAWKELKLAQENVAGVSPVERDLIEALGQRYANPQPEDRMPLDQAYADAMRKVWQLHPDDVEVGVLFAEAMMDLRPWNQWTPQGEPNPGTEEILATLDAVLKMNPQHPFANHLYIHATEASPDPARANAAADRLRPCSPVSRTMSICRRTSTFAAAAGSRRSRLTRRRSRLTRIIARSWDRPRDSLTSMWRITATCSLMPR
jgi:hypothetical protein